MDIEILSHAVSFMDTEAYCGNETCLLVFLKSCTVTLKYGDPAHFTYFASDSCWSRAAIG